MFWCLALERDTLTRGSTDLGDCHGVLSVVLYERASSNRARGFRFTVSGAMCAGAARGL